MAFGKMGARGGFGSFGLLGTASKGIRLSNATFSAGSVVGTPIGTLSVSGGTGTYTFTLTNSASSKVQVAGTNGVNLQAGSAASTASSFSITVHATNGLGGPLGTFDQTFLITAVNLTLSAAFGAFALTGDTMAPAYSFGVDQGSFVLTGENVSLLGANTLAANEGAFALTGEAVGLNISMPAAQGSFTLTGEAATLTAPSTFALTFGAMSHINDATSTTVDYGTTNYPAGATRIVIAIAWIPFATNTITAVNIVGSGATFTQIPGAYVTATGAVQSVDMWISSGPVSGSSGDVQVTYTGHCAWESAISTYGVTTTTPTPGTAGTGFSNSNASNTTSASITVSTGGGAIVVAASGNAHTATFTNTLTPDGNDTASGGGYFLRANATGSFNIVGTWSANDTLAISAVPWAP